MPSRPKVILRARLIGDDQAVALRDSMFRDLETRAVRVQPDQFERRLHFEAVARAGPARGSPSRTPEMIGRCRYSGSIVLLRMTMPRASMRNDLSEAVGSSSLRAATQAIGCRSVIADVDPIRQHPLNFRALDLRQFLDRRARLAEIDQ